MHHYTCLADHFTAPVELTVTVLQWRHALAVMAARAAQQFAAADVIRWRVAAPSHSSVRADAPVCAAEVGRLAGVDEVDVPHWPYGGATDWNDARAVVGNRHVRRAVEVRLQTRTYVTKRRHLAPARLQRAGTGKAVTLAHCAHVLRNRLQNAAWFAAFTVILESHI